MTYEHTQSRPELAVLLFAGAVATAIMAVFLSEPFLFSTPLVLAAVAAIAYALSSITTTVTAETITCAFRWGRPRRVFPIAQVVQAESVRNRWWYGWGIRWIPGGTMFNVWGLDAVHLDLRDARGFRIGTDDQQALVAAINTQISKR